MLAADSPITCVRPGGGRPIGSRTAAFHRQVQHVAGPHTRDGAEDEKRTVGAPCRRSSCDHVARIVCQPHPRPRIAQRAFVDEREVDRLRQLLPEESGDGGTIAGLFRVARGVDVESSLTGLVGDRRHPDRCAWRERGRLIQ
jgi:hypothetical protein